MIIVLKPHATPEVVEHVLERIAALGFTPHLSQGVARTIIGVIGDEDKLQVEPLQAIPGVEQVVPILKPFKLASREFHPEGSVFEVKGVKIGGGHLAMIAGPCAIESESMLFEIAARVRDAGANILRGGAFKPRTSPYSFQGLGRDGLKILQAAGERFGMPVVTEVMDPRQVELVERYADILQIGARNMQNFDLLKECGRTRMPILLKRGMSATVKDLLDVGRVRPVGREPPGDPLRARDPDLRGFDPQHARPVDRAQHPGAEPLADHRRPQPRDRPARPDPGDGAGRRRRGRRRDPHRGPFLPRAGPLRRSAGPGPRPVRPADGRNPPARRTAGQDDRRLQRRTGGMRTLLIAGNWKMNPATRAEAVALAEAVKAGVGQATERPRRRSARRRSSSTRSTRSWPARRSAWARRTCTGSRPGRYTGEVSGAMLVDAGCTHVILGHSERRHGLGETDAQVNAKLHAALAAGLIPIVCVGETKDERQRDETERVLTDAS